MLSGSILIWVTCFVEMVLDERKRTMAAIARPSPTFPEMTVLWRNAGPMLCAYTGVMWEVDDDYIVIDGYAGIEIVRRVDVIEVF